MTTSGASFDLPVRPAGSSAVERKGGSALLPARTQQAVVTMGAFGGALVVIQLVNMITGYWMVQHWGIVPRTLHGLIGIVTAPLLQTGWGHLLANIIPLLVFGFLVLAGGIKQFIAVTALVWVISGLGVWLTAPSGSVTVGASGLVFGYLTYLVCRGFFSRKVSQILIGLVLLAIWGGIFWGLLPGSSGISWQSHLFGAIGGLLAAFLAAKADGLPRRKSAQSSVPATGELGSSGR
jgi:membrane associated rhomboid family serine protease